ncbi:MAG: NAD(P)-dependent oxidoreductase [Acidobacteriota bacterium]
MKSKTKKKIAFLGTGLMGQPMAERLLARGYPLVAFNRTRQKAERLESAGAAIADDPRDAVAQAQCVILMLAHAQAVQEVLLSQEVAAELRGRTVIQMSTISSTQSLEICRRVEAAGGEYLEAPVLGSIPQVLEGQLIVMVGATPRLYENWVEVFQCLGSRTYLVGPPGKAAALKLALNQLIASLTAGFALSLGIVQRAGIDVELFMKILRGSALHAPTFEKKLSRMISRDFDNPNFPVRLLLKDINLALEEAGGLGTAGLQGIRTVVEKTVAEGFAEIDYSAIFNTIVPEMS